MRQSRWKSPVAWASIVALIFFIMKNYGLFVPLGLTEESFKQFVDLIFVALAAVGIFNDPTRKDGF